MSCADCKPVVDIPSLEKLEQIVLESLRQDASTAHASCMQPYSWEDFIDN